MGRVVIETTFREDERGWRALAWSWVARLWWPTLLVVNLAAMFHHKDDGDPTIRFASWTDLLAYSGIVAALAIEVGPGVVWLMDRLARRLVHGAR